MQSYLSDKKVRTKINDAYSNHFEILFGVPQGSLLGWLLFNISMLYDIKDCDIPSYTDDNTPSASSINLYVVINKLDESTNNLFERSLTLTNEVLTNAIFWL